MINTHVNKRTICAPVGDVRAAVDEVMTSLWPGQATVLADDAGAVTFVVAGEPGVTEGDVWLTWSLLPDGEATHVRLSLDELDDGPDAVDELSRVLDVLTDVTHDAGFICR